MQYVHLYEFKWYYKTTENRVSHHEPKQQQHLETWDENLQQGASMADVEKRKSFADMKLVDFTSGFSNFEVESTPRLATKQL